MRIQELEEELQRIEELKRTAQRLAVMVHDSNDAITVQDLEGNILA